MRAVLASHAACLGIVFGTLALAVAGAIGAAAAWLALF
jgi:hypothetical protein